jgi:coproporphyrinogen III oxidase
MATIGYFLMAFQTRILSGAVLGLYAYNWFKPFHADSIQDKPISIRMENLVKRLQIELSEAIEKVEGPSGSRFIPDSWQRKEGGYGISSVLQEGRVFEKAGVNISIIQSPAPKAMLAQMRARKNDRIQDDKEYNMFVAGISTVMHPHNPMVPTFHANYRYFELREEGSDPKSAPTLSWFGGGCDLTPSYLFEQDAKSFHREIKDTCDRHNLSYYPKFKAWCDKYFYNAHRLECRGVGGIFFDDLESDNMDAVFDFVRDCGETMAKQYIPIVERRKDMPFTKEQKQWQQLRRGRYVEFNLVHDRGTKFGLVTPGVRIESVLMSLPLTARWEYNFRPAPGSPEEKLEKVLQTPQDWQ